LAATDSQIQFFKGIQTGLPAIEQKYESIKTELGSIEERQKILYDEQDRLRIQGMELERQRTELEAVTKLAQEVVPLTQTLNDLDAKTKDVALKLEGLTDKVSLLGTADLKIGELEQKLKIVIERSASLRQELNRLENVEKEVSEYEKGHDAFVSKANIYEDHAQGLVKQMTEIDEMLTKKQVDVRMVFEEIVKKITEVKTIESNISVLEDKFTRLMQMREELDQSLTVTIDRSSVIDRYHIRLDNFKIMVDELGSRVDRIVKEIPRMDTVEKDLAGLFDELKTLNSSIASATTDIKNVEAEKLDIQTKFNQLVEIRNTFDKEMKAVETKRAEMTTMMKELDSLWKDISEKAVDGEKAQEQLRIYEDRMSAISFLYDDINYRFGEINRLANRLKSMEENMTKVDGYMDLLKAEFIKVNEDMSKVDVAISSINGVNEKSQGMEERFRKIERYLEELEKGMDGSEELRSMLRQLRVDIDDQRAELISLEGIESKISELRNELMRMEERSASVERGADRLEVAFRKIAMLSMAMDAVQAQQSGQAGQ
jgi:chromosome segregation ATPase